MYRSDAYSLSSFRRYLGLNVRYLPLILILAISLFYNPIWNPDWANQFYPLVFQTTVFLTVGISLFGFVFRGRPCRPTGLDLAIIAYVVYCLFRTMIKTGNHLYYSETFYMWAYLGFYLLMRLSIREMDVIKVVKIAVCFGLLNILMCLLQIINVLSLISPSFNINGTFYNPGPLAGYLAVLAPLTFLLFGSLGQSARYACRLLIFTIFVVFIIISESRAGILSLVFSSIVMILFQYANKLKITGRIVALSLVGLVFLIAAYLSYQVRMDSADGRLLIWKITAGMIKEQPVFGRGLGSFNNQYTYYQAEYFSSNEATDGEKWLAGNVHSPFNECIRILTELGIVGMLLFMVILWTIFRGLKHIAGEMHYTTFCSSIVALLLFALFSYPFQVAANHLIFFLILSLLSVYLPPVVFLIKRPYWGKVAGYAGIVLFSLLAYQAIFVSLAVSKWKKANDTIRYNTAFAIRTYDAILPFLRNKDSFLYNYASQLADLGYYTQALSIYEKIVLFHHDIHLYSQMGRCYQELEKYKEAEEYFRIASCMVPYTLNPQLNLFSLYLSAGQRQKAEEQARKILDTPVKIPTTSAERIRADIRMYLLQSGNNIIPDP